MGGRLVPALLKQGYRVRCLVREPRKLAARLWQGDPNVEVVPGDLGDSEALADQLRGCSVAYYLVHSMVVTGRKYAEQDDQLARNFARAAVTAASSGSSTSAVWGSLATV